LTVRPGALESDGRSGSTVPVRERCSVLVARLAGQIQSAEDHGAKPTDDSCQPRKAARSAQQQRCQVPAQGLHRGEVQLVLHEPAAAKGLGKPGRG
jgi:hypothetical protein